MEGVIEKKSPSVLGTERREDQLDKVNYGLNLFIKESLSVDGAVDALYWTDSIRKQAVIKPKEGYIGIGHLSRLNNIRRVNKFLEKSNSVLERGNFLVVCAETKGSRKIRLLNKYPKIISRPYYFLDFILKRVFPKWKPTRKIYFSITKGKNRVMSFAEVLGRLYSCGFKVHNTTRIGYLTYFLAEKTGKPAYDMEPTYDALVTLNRVGKDGNLFKVYKLRTMHPYSEYIQDYIYENHNLEEGGKFKNDFRVTGWGKVFRKLWIDELPMLWNWLKGEMKLVGVRPLSRHYFSLYPEEMQQLRIQVKPGLVPPFYADLPNTLDEIIESERNYIESYQEKPIRTDIRYFFKAMYNIFIKKARSG